MTELILWQTAAITLGLGVGFLFWRLHVRCKQIEKMEIERITLIASCNTSKICINNLNAELQQIGKNETFMQDIQHQIDKHLGTGE